MQLQEALQIIFSMDELYEKTISVKEKAGLMKAIANSVDVIQFEIMERSRRGDYDGGLRHWLENKGWTPNETIETLVEDWDEW